MGREIKVKGLILHGMSEYIHRDALKYYNVNPRGYAEWLHAKEFLEAIGLSAHGFIAPDGSWIEGNVKAPERALHAGISKHNDLEDLNNHYLGIEILVEGRNNYGEFLEKMKNPDCYSQEQFETTVVKSFEFLRDFKFPIENIVTHEQVSGDHVRGKGRGKKDPGAGFPSDQLIVGVQNMIHLYNGLNGWSEENRL